MQIELSQCRLAFDEAGKGTPILFIHGYPMNRRLWQPQLEDLAEVGHVLALDLRGHGESEQIPGPYSMELFADDCNEFLDVMRIPKVVLCGLSMGGYICMAFYRKYASRVVGMVLTATRAAADSPTARESRDKAIDQAISQGPAPIVEGMINRLLSPYSQSNRPSLITKAHDFIDDISTQTIVADLQGLKTRLDSSSILATISQPVCIIHGEDDQIVPLEEAREMHHTIKHSRLHILPLAGHVPNLEQPGLFNQAVRQFIMEIKS